MTNSLAKTIFDIRNTHSINHIHMDESAWFMSAVNKQTNEVEDFSGTDMYEEEITEAPKATATKKTATKKAAGKK